MFEILGHLLYIDLLNLSWIKNVYFEEYGAVKKMVIHDTVNSRDSNQTVEISKSAITRMIQAHFTIKSQCQKMYLWTYAPGQDSDQPALSWSV